VYTRQTGVHYAQVSPGKEHRDGAQFRQSGWGWSCPRAGKVNRWAAEPILFIMSFGGNMIIVMIHWRIKPSEEAVHRFFDFWQNIATIKDQSGLVGEFLSEPLPAEQVPFKVNDLSSMSDELPYISFVNVGFWRDMQTFHQQVGKYFNDENPPLEFEQYHRERTILEPKEWRIGNYELPTQSSF
jgi:hypothetical protein